MVIEAMNTPFYDFVVKMFLVYYVYEKGKRGYPCNIHKKTGAGARF
jgi:hypothetical protein